MKSDLVDFNVVLLAETPTAWKVRRLGGPYPATWVPRADAELYEADATGARQLTTSRRVAVDRGLLR